MGRQSHKAIERILKIGSMTEDEAKAFMMSESLPRWKPMQVAYADNLHNPRCLILEVNPKLPQFRYTTCSQSGGVGSHSDASLRTLKEWLVWLDRFSDDLTGREMRDAKEAAQADFTEPDFWRGFRERFAATGDPWLPETPNDQAHLPPPETTAGAQKGHSNDHD